MAIPNHAKQQLIDGWLSSATIKCALGGSGTAYTFDEAAHEFLGDVFDSGTTGEEIDYTSPGDRQTLSNVSITQDDTDNEGVLDCDNVTFPSLSTTQDIQFIVFYVQIGGDDSTPGDDPILALYDDDSAGSLADLPLATNGSDVTLTIDSEGLLNVT